MYAVEESREKMTVDGLERSYIVSAPQGLEPPRAMMVALHGSTQRGSLIRRTSGFDELVGREGWLMVYPDAVGGIWRDGRGDDDVDDVSFLAELVETLRGRFSIADDAVFVVGASNGGFMVLRLLCEVPELFRGAAAVIATMGLDTFQACFPSKLASMLLIAAKDDPIVPYEGGQVVRVDGGRYRGHTLSFDDTVEFWRGQGEWEEDGGAVKDELEPGVWREQRCFVAPGGEPRLKVVSLSGVGHHWFGRPMPESLQKVFGRTTEAYKVSEDVWQFFSALLGKESCR